MRNLIFRRRILVLPGEVERKKDQTVSENTLFELDKLPSGHIKLIFPDIAQKVKSSTFKLLRPVQVYHKN